MVKTVFFGTPLFAVPCFRLLSARTELLAAVVRPDRPRGRGRKVVPPPVKEAAVELGVEVLQPEKMKEPDFLGRLDALAPDLIVTAAYGRIIPPVVLSLPRHGCWNVHASLLPRYRGAAPIHRAIWEGETETGITLMQMDEGLDTGAVLLKRSCPIGDEDTVEDLTKRLAELGAEVLDEGLRALDEGTLAPTPQPEEGTYAPMIGAEETTVDWNKPAARIRNQVRALAPRPGAHTRTPAGDVRLLEVRALSGGDCPSGDEAVPGRVVSVSKKELVLAAGEGTCLEIVRIQPAGKAAMPVAAFLQGRAVCTGDRWGEGSA